MGGGGISLEAKMAKKPFFAFCQRPKWVSESPKIEKNRKSSKYTPRPPKVSSEPIPSCCSMLVNDMVTFGHIR